MNIYSKNIITMMYDKDKSIQVQFEDGHLGTVTADNIYDIIENSTMGKHEYIFVNKDNNFPIVEIVADNRGGYIDVKAKFKKDYFEFTPIADLSPNGLMKWLHRAYSYNTGGKMYNIYVREDKNE